MKKVIFSLLFNLLLLNIFAQVVNIDAVNPTPDTLRLGIYVTSIHDIDFKQKEYKTIFWL